MKKGILLLGMLFSIVWGSLRGQNTGNQIGFITKIGNLMPDFVVEMLDGKVVDSKELRGKVILLDFWGAKCGGCLVEMKRFPEEVVKTFGKHADFFLLPIEAQHHSKNEIEDTAERLGFNFPLAYENGKDIAGLFFNRIFGLPRTLIIDRDGKIVYQSFGYSEEEFKSMLKTLEKTLDRKY